MRNLFICTVLSAFCLYSCNNTADNGQGKKTDSTAVTHIMQPKSKLDDAGTQKLMAVVNNYYDLKNALVATNAGKADAAANKLIAAAGSMQEAFAKDSANGQTLKPFLDTIVTESKAMTSMMDEGCEKKRVNFEKISGAMFAMLKQADLKNAGIYREYCPMAFNEKGAYWLSNDPEIKNPYFGEKMLECGEVTDSLK